MFWKVGVKQACQARAAVGFLFFFFLDCMFRVLKYHASTESELLLFFHVEGVRHRGPDWESARWGELDCFTHSHKCWKKEGEVIDGKIKASRLHQRATRKLEERSDLLESKVEKRGNTFPAFSQPDSITPYELSSRTLIWRWNGAGNLRQTLSSRANSIDSPNSTSDPSHLVPHTNQTIRDSLTWLWPARKSSLRSLVEPT